MKKEKVKNAIKHNWIWATIAVVLIVIFAKIAEDVFEKEIFGFDYSIYNYILNHRNTILNTIFKVITYAGSAYVVLPVTICCVIFIKVKKDKKLIPLNLLIIILLNIVLKNIFARPRPDNMRLMQASGYSFPSGHAMVSTAFYGYLIYLTIKNIQNRKAKIAISTALALLIILIDFSRIYIGVHYVSDVIGGTVFSIVYLIAFVNINKLIEYEKNNKIINEHIPQQ